MAEVLQLFRFLIELDIFDNELNGCCTVVGVQVRAVNNIEKFILLQFLFELAHFESDTPHRCGVVGNGYLQMIAA